MRDELAFHTREEFLGLFRDGQDVFLEIRHHRQRVLVRAWRHQGRWIDHDAWLEDGNKVITRCWSVSAFTRYTWARRTVEDWLLAEITGHYVR